MERQLPLDMDQPSNLDFRNAGSRYLFDRGARMQISRSHEQSLRTGIFDPTSPAVAIADELDRVVRRRDEKGEVGAIGRN